MRNLLNEIITLDRGYVTVRSGNWDLAFAAKNPKGYINIKVRHHEFLKFVTFGYLDVAKREARTNPWCEVRDQRKVMEIQILVKDLLAGRIAFEDAPNPRGKPPGSGGRKSSGGYRRSAPRTEAPTEAPRTEAPPTGDVAAMVQAIQDERDMLAQKVAGLEARLADAEARANMRAERPVDGDTVIIDGKAAKIWRLAVGEYGEGNMEAAANMLHKVMVMVS